MNLSSLDCIISSKYMILYHLDRGNNGRIKGRAISKKFQFQRNSQSRIPPHVERAC
jgi:hypothetical protein